MIIDYSAPLAQLTSSQIGADGHCQIVTPGHQILSPEVTKHCHNQYSMIPDHHFPIRE